jgi:DNA-binding response OmpR family regulator
MKTVLLVDDEDYVREILGNFIERKGFRALRAQNGQEAIDLFQANSPDCVFLDVKLPDSNGEEVFEKIKKLNPGAKIYFLTGVDDNVFKEKVQSLGALGYLVKPIALNEVSGILSAL